MPCARRLTRRPADDRRGRLRRVLPGQPAAVVPGRLRHVRGCRRGAGRRPGGVRPGVAALVPGGAVPGPRGVGTDGGPSHRDQPVAQGA